MPRISQARDLETLRQHFIVKRERVKMTIVVCGGTGCQASRAGSVIDAVRAELARQGLMQDVVVRVTGCHGFCEQGPIMVFEPGNLFYCHVTPNDAQDIVSRTVKEGRGHRQVPLHGPRLRQKGHEGSRNSLLQRPGAAAACLQQARRRLLHRRLHRHRRLQGDRQDPQGIQARGHHLRDQGLGPARPRRGRVPHGPQVGGGPRGARR